MTWPGEEQRDGGDGADRRAGEAERGGTGPRPASTDRTAPATRVRNATAATRSADGVARRRGRPQGRRPSATVRRPRRGSTDRRQQRRIDPEHLADPVAESAVSGGPSATMRPSAEHHDPREPVAASPRSWRTATIVVPSRALRSARSSMTSTWWRRSRWTVGSSRTMIGAAWATATRAARAGARRARARARRGRADARARPARSPPRRPPGRPGAGRGSGPRAAAGRARRPPRRAPRTAGRRPAGTTAIRRATACAVEAATGAPSSATRPGRRLEEPGHERAAASTCPAPFGPTSATRSPALDREVDVAEHRAADRR